MNHFLAIREALERVFPPDSHTRREFVARSGSAFGGLWLLGLLQACETASSDAIAARAAGSVAFETLDDREGLDFEAFSAVIVPTDDTPGAREAGSVYFADRALGSFVDFLLPAIRDGLADLAERARRAEPSATAFADLSEDDRVAVVREVERDAPGFFGAARLLVLLGLVSNPEYGGNRDKVGWRLIGFEDAFQFEPPFGAFDRAGTAEAES